MELPFRISHQRPSSNLRWLFYLLLQFQSSQLYCALVCGVRFRVPCTVHSKIVMHPTARKEAHKAHSNSQGSSLFFCMVVCFCFPFHPWRLTKRKSNDPSVTHSSNTSNRDSHTANEHEHNRSKSKHGRTKNCSPDNAPCRVPNFAQAVRTALTSFYQRW